MVGTAYLVHLIQRRSRRRRLARRAAGSGRNQLVWSNDFTNAAWTKNGTGTLEAGPFAGKSTPPTGENSTRLEGLGLKQAVAGNPDASVSLYARSLTGADATWAFWNGQFDDVKTIPITWVRLESTSNEHSGEFDFYPWGTGGAIEVASAQANPGASPETYTPTAGLPQL